MCTFGVDAFLFGMRISQPWKNEHRHCSDATKYETLKCTNAQLCTLTAHIASFIISFHKKLIIFLGLFFKCFDVYLTRIVDAFLVNKVHFITKYTP